MSLKRTRMGDRTKFSDRKQLDRRQRRAKRPSDGASSPVAALLEEREERRLPGKHPGMAPGRSRDEHARELEWRR